MVDPDDDGLVLVVIEAMHDPVGASTRRPFGFGGGVSHTWTLLVIGGTGGRGTRLALSGHPARRYG